MANNDLEIHSSYLLTKEKSPIKSLFTGRLLNDLVPGNFVFYLIEIDTAPEDATRAKKVIVDTLEKNFQNNELFNQTYLENSLENINNSLELIARSGEKQWIGNLNAVIGIIENDTLHLASTGKISGYLIRKGKLSSLTDNSNISPIPQKTFIDITSGPLTISDKIFFGNNILYDYLSLDRIRRILENQYVGHALSEMLKNLKHKKISHVNAIFLEVLDKTKTQAPLNQNFQEFYYLDEKEENALQKLRSVLGPHAKVLLNKSGDFIILSKNVISKNGQIVIKNVREKWREKYKPKAREVIKKSAPLVAQTYKNVITKIGPISKKTNSKELENIKIKTKIYTSKSISKLELFFQSVSVFIKNFLTIAKKRENRKFLYLIIIICLLGIGYMKVRSNNIAQDKKSESQKLSEMLPQAETAYNTARENLSLGRTKDTLELENALIMAKKSSELPENKDKSDKLIKEIQQTIDQMNVTTRLYNPAITISIGSKIQKSILVGSEIYSVNVEGKIYSSSTNSKEKVLVASIGRENGDVLDMTYSESDQTIYILTNKQKVIGYNTNSKTNETISTDGVKDWEKAVSISSFSSSLYLLNSESGEVIKHTKQESGFSKGAIYAGSSKVDLKNSINLKIDGNVYVLLNNGQIAKFSKGVFDPSLILKNPPDPGSIIKSPVKLITGVDINNFYIFDRAMNRIIKFDKSGIFIKQYAVDGVNIDDFLINNKIQKAWIISDSNIYEIDL